MDEDGLDRGTLQDSQHQEPRSSSRSFVQPGISHPAFFVEVAPAFVLPVAAEPSTGFLGTLGNSTPDLAGLRFNSLAYVGSSSSVGESGFEEDTGGALRSFGVDREARRASGSDSLDLDLGFGVPGKSPVPSPDSLGT